ERVTLRGGNTEAADWRRGQAGRVRSAYARRAEYPVRPALVYRRARLPEVGRRGAGRAPRCGRRGDRFRRGGERGVLEGLRGGHDRQTRPVNVPADAAAR